MNNKRIAVLLTVFSIMFLSLILYITMFDLVNRNIYATDHVSEREEYVVRGSVKDRNGIILAESKGSGKKQKRIYPYKNLYSHIIGYKSPSHGSNEIEKYYNSDLTGKSTAPIFGDFVTFFEDAKSTFGLSKGRKGYDIELTIDHELQKAAYNALGSYNGSVVAIEPSSGKILAMVSKPDFDPSPDTLDKSLKDANNQNNHALLRRATMETYPPGSIFKLIVTASMLENDMEDFVFDDSGSLTVKVKNYGDGDGKFLGETDLELGFKSSSNIYFSEAANALGDDKIRQTAKNFCFGENIRMSRLGVSKSTVPNDLTSAGDITNLALGQGDVKATPLHLAMIASAIANDGTMMEPYIVDCVSGTTKMYEEPSVLNNCTSKAVARKIKNLMKACVDSGTGSGAAIYGRDVCGKTGTAEIDTEAGTAHALFAGFAPYDNPGIAICVVVENLPNKNTGGSVAAPIARQVLMKYFELK